MVIEPNRTILEEFRVTVAKVNGKLFTFVLNSLFSIPYKNLNSCLYMILCLIQFLFELDPQYFIDSDQSVYFCFLLHVNF